MSSDLLAECRTRRRGWIRLRYRCGSVWLSHCGSRHGNIWRTAVQSMLDLFIPQQNQDTPRYGRCSSVHHKTPWTFLDCARESSQVVVGEGAHRRLLGILIVSGSTRVSIRSQSTLEVGVFALNSMLVVRMQTTYLVTTSTAVRSANIGKCPI